MVGNLDAGAREVVPDGGGDVVVALAGLPADELFGERLRGVVALNRRASSLTNCFSKVSSRLWNASDIFLSISEWPDLAAHTVRLGPSALRQYDGFAARAQCDPKARSGRYRWRLRLSS
jgi:hypothetical protein